LFPLLQKVLISILLNISQLLKKGQREKGVGKKGRKEEGNEGRKEGERERRRI